MVAELGWIVRCRRRRTREPERYLLGKRDDLAAQLPVIALQDRRLIQHDASECVRLEVLKHLVVRDVHAERDVGSGSADVHRYAELLAFARGLLGDCQRRDNQDDAAVTLAYEPRPFQLHRRLAESAIGEDRGPSLGTGPRYYRPLKVEQLRVDIGFVNVESVAVIVVHSRCQEPIVVVWHVSSPQASAIRPQAT